MLTEYQVVVGKLCLLYLSSLSAVIASVGDSLALAVSILGLVGLALAAGTWVALAWVVDTASAGLAWVAGTA